MIGRGLLGIAWGGGASLPQQMAPCLLRRVAISPAFPASSAATPNTLLDSHKPLFYVPNLKGIAKHAGISGRGPRLIAARYERVWLPALHTGPPGDSPPF